MWSLAKKLLSSVTSIFDRIFDLKEKKEDNSHEEQAALYESYAAEFDSESSNWFDALIDGINRLPRPMMALGVISLFVYAYMAPADFAVSMQALTIVPEPLWHLLGIIVTFYFGVRAMRYDLPKAIEKMRSTNVKEVVKEIKRAKKINQTYEEEMKDDSAPMSDDAIAEWNRRNNPDYKG